MKDYNHELLKRARKRIGSFTLFGDSVDSLTDEEARDALYFVFEMYEKERREAMMWTRRDYWRFKSE